MKKPLIAYLIAYGFVVALLVSTLGYQAYAIKKTTESTNEIKTVADNLKLGYEGNIISASTGASFVPATDLTYDLGAADKRWRYLYAGQILLSGVAQNQLIVGNGGTVSSTLENDSLAIAQQSGYNSGKFSVDSSGNVSTSGTMYFSGGANISGSGASVLTVSTPFKVGTATGLIYIAGNRMIEHNSAGVVRLAEDYSTIQLFSSTMSLTSAGALKINKIGLGTTPTNMLDLLESNTSEALMTVASSTLLSTTTLAHDYLSLGNNNFTSSANGTTTIGSLETGNLTFPDNAGLVRAFNLAMTTTTAGIAMGYDFALDDSPMMALWGETTALGTINMNTRRILFFNENGTVDFTNHGGTNNLGGMSKMASSTYTTSNETKSIFTMDLGASTTTINRKFRISGKADGSDKFFHQEITVIANNYQGGTINWLDDVSAWTSSNSSTWAGASSTFSGTVLNITVQGENGTPIFWNTVVDDQQIIY